MNDKDRLALLEKGVKSLRSTTQGFKEFEKSGKGSAWKAGMKALDELAADLRRAPATQTVSTVSVKHVHLGPVIPGHKTLCNNDLTHETDGFAFHPAFDDMAKPGSQVIAPEDLTITKWGSAQGGESIHATGASGIHYWFGHVDQRVPVGTKVAKGQRFANVSGEHKAPHVHVGIDARVLIGRELEHHTNYTHGGPTVCAQLTGSVGTTV